MKDLLPQALVEADGIAAVQYEALRHVPTPKTSQNSGRITIVPPDGRGFGDWSIGVMDGSSNVLMPYATILGAELPILA